MFANTTANTKVGVHIGALEPHLYCDSFSRRQRSARGIPCREGHLVAGIANYEPTLLPPPVGGCNIVIARSQLIRRQTSPLKFQGLLINLEKAKYTISNRTEVFPGKNGLWAHRAVLLADYRWPVDGPGQTATPINKGGAQSDWTDLGVFFSTKFLFQGDRPDRRSGTDV